MQDYHKIHYSLVCANGGVNSLKHGPLCKRAAHVLCTLDVHYARPSINKLIQVYSGMLTQ